MQGSAWRNHVKNQKEIVDLAEPAALWTLPETTREHDSHMFSLTPKGHENVFGKL